MTIFRRVCICLTVIGALLLLTRNDSPFETVPFPTAGLTVKMTANVITEGDYFLEVTMPKADQEIALAEETVPCSLTVSMKGDDKPLVTSDVTSLSRWSEFGFAGIQYYKGGNWHLSRGKYVVQISSRASCKAAVSRGATLSLGQEVTHVTERFLGGVLRYWSGVFALCAGLLGVILCEFLRRPKTPLQPTGAPPGS
jgi:hypothetical protein